MADQEVNIKVRQTSEGDAIEQTKKQIEELKRLAAFRESSGDALGARFARQDAARLEAEVTRHTREQRVEQRQISQEKREQAAVARAQDSRLARIARAGGHFAQDVAGGSPLGGLASAIGGVSPAGLAATFAVSIASAIGLAVAGQRRELRLLAAADVTERASMSFAQEREAGVEGSAAAARASAMEKRAEIARREADRGRLQEQAAFEWNPATWLAYFSGAKANPLRENELAITRLKEGVAENERITRDKFGIEGELELEQQRARVEGRYKEAIAIEAAVQAGKRYKELRLQGASPEEAREGADLALRQRQIDVTRGLGRLAGARDGRANLAALASLGAGTGLGSRDVIDRLDRVVAGIEGARRDGRPLHNHFAR